MSIRWIAERRDTAALWALVAVPMLLTALALLPELTIPVPSNNDDATHFLLIQRASDALARGENVLDPWVPQLELGFPWFIYYQPLPALVVVFLHRALFGLVDLLTVFNLVRYSLLVGFPVTVYWSLRRMGVAPAGAAVAAAVAPLFSGDFRYGFEYDSYTWRGFGMFTQLWAMHLSFVTFAACYRLFTQGKDARLATFAFSVLVLSHLIYAYMMGITLVALFVLTQSWRSAAKSAIRIIPVLVASAAITAMLWVPFISSRAYLGVTPYLQSYKYDSYGAPAILGWLVTGDLFDHGRLPVVTLLVGVGVLAAVWRRTVIARVALGLFVLWLVLYFGRPTLGPLVDLLPFHEGLLLHRFIGSVELFAIVLVGVGAAWAFERFGASRSRSRLVLATAAALVLLVPAIGERATFYSSNTTWMRQTEDAIAADADARSIIEELTSRPSGRVFAGLRDTAWGRAMNFAIPFNSVRFSDLLVFNGLPVVASPYSSITLNADLMWDFAVDRREHYDLFNVAYVVAPAGSPVPSFLVPLRRTERYVLYAAPTSGYAELAARTTPEAAGTQARLFLRNRAWVDSSEPGSRSFIRWSYPATASPPASGPATGCADGTIGYERTTSDRLDVIATCPAAGALILKVTYHPNWRVFVDDRPAETFMASPSYLGIELPPGQHFITAVYEPTPAKTPLLVLGLGVAVLVAGAPWLRRRDRWLSRVRPRRAGTEAPRTPSAAARAEDE